MVLYESEDITFQKLNTYKFDSRLSVTIIIDVSSDNVDTPNVEKNNSPPAFGSVHLPNLTNNTRDKYVAKSTAVKNNHMQYLLYHLSKKVISILLKQYSTVNGNCDHSHFLKFKYEIFRKSEKTVVDIILPNHTDPIFIQKFFNDTKNLAKNENILISITEIKALLCEMVNFLIKKIENDQRGKNNKYPLLAERLQCVSKFFTTTEISLNNQKTARKRKKENNTENNARKQNKLISEEHESSATNKSLISEKFSYKQTYGESLLYNDGNKTTNEPSNEKAISSFLLTVDNNQQTQLAPADIPSKLITGQCPPYPIITHETSLNPQISLAVDGNCSMCNAITKNLCIGCFRYYYCSLECQILQWPEHWYECNKST